MDNQASESDAPPEVNLTPSAPQSPSARPVFLPPRPTPRGRATPWPQRIFPESFPAPAPDGPEALGSSTSSRAPGTGAPGLKSSSLASDAPAWREEANGKIATLEAQLSAAEGLVRRTQAEALALRKTVEQQRNRIAELMVREQELQARVGELETQAVELTLRAEGQRSGPQRQKVTGSVAPTAEARDRSVDDDLTVIRGIGPVFARALRVQGVTRIFQIAAWQEEELERIATLIKVSPERIRREGWIAAAQQWVSGMNS